MKLLADAMLGRLARWLRILGYDTTYLADTDDYTVMRVARAEGRLLLTRDRALAARIGLGALLITGETLEDQLRQVLSTLGPASAKPFTRCPICNTPLEPVDREMARAWVPPYVYQTQSQFYHCPDCNRFYWPGTHWQQMRALLSRVDSTVRDGTSVSEQKGG